MRGLKVISKISSAMKTIASKWLDTGPLPSGAPSFLSDKASVKFDLEVEELKELIALLKSKHAVDSIVVAHHNGSLLVSSNGSDLKEAIVGTAMLNYIRSELPESTAIFIKEKHWYMLYSLNRKVYVVRAPSNLQSMELKAIAEDMEGFLKNHAE